MSMTEEEREKCRLVHLENLQAGIALAESGNCDLLILDEAIGAYNEGLIDRQLLQNFVDINPSNWNWF